MKKLLILGLIAFSSTTYANQQIWSMPKKQSSAPVYQKLMGDLDQIGETKYEEKNQKDLDARVTNLLSWTRSDAGKEQITLSSGVFTMLAPKKTNLTPEEVLYTKTFSKDSYGSAFLYKGYVVTNFHMCRGLNTLIRDHTNTIYSVKVLKYNVKQDICILRAPAKVVKDQNDFASKTMPENMTQEEIRQLRIENAILKIKQKTTEPLSEDNLNKIIALQKELASDDRDYGYISGAYGNFYIYNIKEDTLKDQWKKDNSFTAYGEKCKGGVSGSPVLSKKGIMGLFWGAEAEEEESPFKVKSRSPATDTPKLRACYFLAIEEVDKIISQYEMEIK